MVFHWSLSDSKSPQVSRTLLTILVILNNLVVWMVSIRPPTFKSFRPFNNPFVSVPKAPITIGIIVTFMFHFFFDSLGKSGYVSFFSLSFCFILWSAGTKSTIYYCYYYLLIRVFPWSLSDSKSPQISRTLLNILAVLNSAVVWTVSSRPPIHAPIPIGIIVTCIFHSFFNSQARSRYLSFFSYSFSFILWSAGTEKSTILQVLFLLLLLLGLVFWPGLVIRLYVKVP